MRQILITKENTWTQHGWAPFFQTFLSFPMTLPHDKIPFKLLFHMHDAPKLVYHYFRQYLVVMHILFRVYGVRHDHITLDHLSIQKTDIGKTFLMVLDETQQFVVHCPYGYHIHVNGFEHSTFRHVSSSLITMDTPQDWNSTRRLCKTIYKRLGKECSQEFRNMVGHAKRQKVVLLGVKEHRTLMLQLFPLVYTNTKHVLSIHDQKTIEKEVSKMFQIFYKEYELFRSKFSKMTCFEALIRDWVDILVMYKKDFFQEPELTMTLLRKILYQYMVDHHYSHVSFKTFDLSRMLISLFMWAQWYEIWLQRTGILALDFSKESLVFIGCLDTFIDTDELHTLHELHVLDFKHRQCSTQTVPENISSRLLQTHPLLRAQYLHDEILKR